MCIICDNSLTYRYFHVRRCLDLPSVVYHFSPIEVYKFTTQYKIPKKKLFIKDKKMSIVPTEYIISLFSFHYLGSFTSKDLRSVSERVSRFGVRYEGRDLGTTRNSK